MLTRSSLLPPENVICKIDETGTAFFTWDYSLDDVDGYKVYLNDRLEKTLPQIDSLFEFPFSNESLEEAMLELSEIIFSEYSTPLLPKTHYVFKITSYKGTEESEPIIVNVYYEFYISIKSVSVDPNPVNTSGILNISAEIETGINSTIS